MKLTIEELEIIDQAFEYIFDTSGVKLEENELWDKIKGYLKMSKQITKINYHAMTVEDGGILYDMEDLARLSRIYERLCTAEYLFQNQSADKPMTMEQAYEMADFIRDKMDDYCTCESETITYWYAEAYADRVLGIDYEEGEDNV